MRPNMPWLRNNAGGLRHWSLSLCRINDSGYGGKIPQVHARRWEAMLVGFLVRERFPEGALHNSSSPEIGLSGRLYLAVFHRATAASS